MGWMLSRAKRGISRIKASKSASCSARTGLEASMYATSTPGALRNGSTSKSGKVGEPSAFLKSPDNATRNLSAMVRHRFLQPARSSATASVSAFCSTHTSPE